MTTELPAAPSTATRSALPDAFVERIFQRMEDRYGALWADRYGAFPRDRVMRTWAEDLADLSRDELVRGMTACKDRKFPPTLPEFREMCRPPIDAEAAYSEAVEQMRRRERGEDRWSHPAIFWAAANVGTFDLRNGTWGSLKSRWTKALQAELEKGHWPEIPQRVPELPYRPTAEDQERARQAARAAKEAVSAGKLNGGIDTHWATHPRSHRQFEAILGAAKNDHRFRPCIAEMVEKGICTAEGKLLKIYQNQDFVAA